MNPAGNRDQKTVRKPLITDGLLCFLGIFLLMANAAYGHSPLFPQDNHDIASAFAISDGMKSWVAYSAIRKSGQIDFYRLHFSHQDKIRIKLLTSNDPADTKFLPCIVLLVPGLQEIQKIPWSVAIPAGYGTILIQGIEPPSATYEPFAQGWFYDLAELDMIAPVTGIYYLAVFAPSGSTGSYAVTIGYLERWTLPELIALPWNIRRIQLWEGQNLFAALAPFFALFALGSFWMFLRSRKGKTPHTLSQWFASLAGLAFMASAVGSIHQMLLASRIAPIHKSDLIITLIAAAIPAILAAFVLRYGLGRKKSYGITWRIGLIAIAIVGLILFTGLYLGPILSFLAAVTRSRISIRQERPSY